MREGGGEGSGKLKEKGKEKSEDKYNNCQSASQGHPNTPGDFHLDQTMTA